jgi:hypothetical protein
MGSTASRGRRGGIWWAQAQYILCVVYWVMAIGAWAACLSYVLGSVTTRVLSSRGCPAWWSGGGNA